MGFGRGPTPTGTSAYLEPGCYTHLNRDTNASGPQPREVVLCVRPSTCFGAGMTKAERAVLDTLSLGTVEARFPRGVGEATLAGLVAKGWIEPARNDDYEVDGFRVTKAGEAAWEAGG